MKNFIKKLLPEALLYRLMPYFYIFYKNVSYSQEGEDLILKRHFEGRGSGFYVDVGAHHPVRFSNTYYFYRKGWNGINIDAMPGSMRLFKQFRSRDTNLEIAISDSKMELDYFIFSEPALNGFSKELSETRSSKTKLLATKKITTLRLDEILDQHLPKGVRIDFMSIDIEGLDLQALKSNNWQKYRPEFILIEIYNLKMNELHQNEIYSFLSAQGYELVSKSVYTCIFQSVSLKKT